MSGGLSSNPILRLRAAESEPRYILKHLGFWKRQQSFAMIVLLSILAFIGLGPFTYQFAEGWIVFTVGSQLLAVWGGVITAKALALIEVETSIVGEVESRSAKYLGDIKGGHGQRIDLDKLEETILPRNLTIPPPAMIRLFQHICKEARDRKFESSVNVTQSYREEQLEDIFRLQNLQKIALWLGILGTFVGLLLAIKTASLTNAGSNEDFIAIINGMFSKLFISFSASLAGLEAAVILGFFILLLRRNHQTYFQNMETAVVTMLSLARNSINKDEYLAEFDQIRYSLNSLGDRVYDQTQQLLELQLKVKAQTDEMHSGMDKLAEARTRFDGFLQEVAEEQKQFMEDVRYVHSTMSLKELGATLEQNIVHTGKQLSDTLGLHVSQISTQISRFNDSLDKLGGTINTQTSEATRNAKNIEGLINARAGESANQVSAIGKQLQGSIGRAEANVSRILTYYRELSDNMASLNSRLSRIYRTWAGAATNNLWLKTKRRFREWLSSLGL